MINIPIGEYFEALVRWLKETFKGLFDAISGILDFSIQVLEETLLLEVGPVYPSVLFGLILAFVAGLLGRRFLGGKGFFIVFAAVAAVFAAAESWRVSALSERLTPERAGPIEEDFAALRQSLEEVAPEDFSSARELLAEIRDSQPGDAPRDTPAHEVRDAADDGIREIERARSSDYDDVFDALEETAAAVAEFGVELPDGLAKRLIEVTRRYEALTLLEESERLVDDLQEVAEGAEPEPLNEFINLRSYSEIQELLAAARVSYAESEPEIAEQAAAASKAVRILNPNRLTWYAPAVTIILLGIIAYLIAGGGVTVFTVVGLLVILTMELWVPTMETLALVLSATLFALLIGVPTGILTARSETADRAVRPILDFMQTMPAFVYLIPAVIFFGLGKVPGAIATLVFAMPPAVRLTSLGIRQVPSEVVEAGQAFGATAGQLLLKAQLPIAMPTILAGVNQTIMLALSMVVIGGMIGAGGLGEVVLSGITQLKLGLGFEGGIAVVILAIYLDRVTQALGSPKS